jgi:glycosyltransferase involved in cell wall biosynthesis
MLPTERTILVLLPFLVRGAMSLAIVREMRRRGLRVSVATFDICRAYTPDDASDFLESNDLIDLAGLGRSKCLDAVLDELSRRNVGLILQIGASQAYRLFPYIREAAPHVQIVDTIYNEIGHTVNHFLYERSLHGVIVESQYMKRFIVRDTLLEEPSVHVQESGIDLHVFAGTPIRPAGEEIVIGYVGRMAPEKNPLGFVDLAGALTPLCKSFTFLMFGEGDLGLRVKDHIKVSNQSQKIRYMGYTDDVNTALEQIDILVVPSIVDGRPNIVMEANARGIPVIAAPVGGLPEMIEDGVNGYVLSPKDIVGFSKLLSKLERDRANLQHLKEQSRATALARFDRAAMMDRYEDLFQFYLSKSSVDMVHSHDLNSRGPSKVQ